MKTIKLFFIAILGGLVFNSCQTDDEFYNSVYLSVPDLITIDTPDTYAVGDYVSFHTNFSRYLPEPGQSSLLDIYRTSGANSFGFAYRLERLTAPNVWTSVLLNGNEFSVENALYEPEYLSYESSEAIQLNEAGEYRLSFGQSFSGSDSTDLISANEENKTAVVIATNANDVDSEGYYYFTVN